MTPELFWLTLTVILTGLLWGSLYSQTLSGSQPQWRNG
jgi:hypothetical protein